MPHTNFDHSPVSFQNSQTICSASLPWCSSATVASFPGFILQDGMTTCDLSRSQRPSDSARPDQTERIFTSIASHESLMDGLLHHSICVWLQAVVPAVTPSWRVLTPFWSSSSDLFCSYLSGCCHLRVMAACFNFSLDTEGLMCPFGHPKLCARLRLVHISENLLQYEGFICKSTYLHFYLFSKIMFLFLRTPGKINQTGVGLLW